MYRYLPAYFPTATLLINFSGSVLIGIILFGAGEREALSLPVKLFLTVGFCGGFTTFSTFSYETFTLLRDSEYLLALLNAAGSVLLCIAGVFLAYLVTKA